MSQRPPRSSAAAPTGVYQLPRLRLALGLGDQELEQRLRPALDAADDLVIVAQCLAADQLLQAVESRQVDAVVAAWSLHRLTDALLDQLDRSGVPLVLLVPNPADERWRNRRGPVVPLDAEPEAIRRVVLASRRGERVLIRPKAAAEPVVLKAADSPDRSTAPGVIAVAGGAGSPGRTTVAISLAAALGAVAPTVLVEIDLAAPALAAYLDCDPSRNLCTLAHAVREAPHGWSHALEDELQPLRTSGSSASVLCGPPKREMRTSIAPAFVERLIAELAERYRYVVVDVGSELLGMETAAANHRAALASVDQVLLVTASNLVGLWHARTALDQLDRVLGIPRQAVKLVLNRHDPRYHHARSEVEWHLGTPVVAVIPFDYSAAERAVAQQRPLVVDARSRAGRALLALAEQVHDGKVRLTPQTRVPDASVRWWQRMLGRHQPTPRRLSIPAPQPMRVVATRDRREQAR